MPREGWLLLRRDGPSEGSVGSPLLHDVVEFVGGFVVLQPLRCAPLTLPIRLPQLTDKDLQAEQGSEHCRASTAPSSQCTDYLVFPELVDDGLMQEEFDVFEEIEGPCRGGAFVHLLLVLGLMGVNPLQDAEAPVEEGWGVSLLPSGSAITRPPHGRQWMGLCDPPEIGQAELQLLACLVAGDVVGGRAPLVLGGNT